MALLTEGDPSPLPVYKHGPPGGGRPVTLYPSINMALLTEGDTSAYGFHSMAILRSA
jgi:hypothetical protein